MTNEPTTEIVRALREDCSLLDDNTDKFAAADRLASQARAIAERDAYIELLKENVEALENDAINYDMNLTEMTARAESAERERDAIALELDMMRANENENGLCLICKKKCAQAANGCFFCKDFEWRGLQPHDGVGK